MCSIRTRSATPMRGAAMPCACTASMLNCSTARRSASSCHSSISTMRAFPFEVGCSSHDAVAWGYARSADSRGVDIIQHCAATGFRIGQGRILGVETEKGYIAAKKVALTCAGNSTRVAALAGLRLPIESHSVQAFVTEGVKPLIDVVMTFGAGHFYVSQSDKGGLVFGGDIEGYNSYAQRGNLPVIEDVCEGGMALMPLIGRLRILRSWGGLLDMTMDGSPIIDKTAVDGLYLNAG